MTARTGDRRTAPLLGHAGPDLYRRNAFRVTDLATDADLRAVSHRRQQLTTVLKVRDHIEPSGPVPLPEPADAQAVRAAFADLGDPRTRLSHELFWLWGTPTDCGCPAKLHERHDATVLDHALALDGEQDADMPEPELDRRWRAAITGWNALLAEPAMWRHVRHRIQRIDDPRLDQAAVRQLRTTLPQVLVTSSVATAMAAAGADRTRLLRLLDAWRVDASLLKAVTTEVSEPLLAKAEAAVDEAHRLLADGQPRKAGGVVVKRVRPVLADLRALAPPERHRATARVMDQAAVVLANSAVALLEQLGPRGVLGSDAAGRISTSGKFLRQAASLATRDDTKAGITSLRGQWEQLSDALEGRPVAGPDLDFLPGTGWQVAVVCVLAFGAVFGGAYAFDLPGSWCTVVVAVVAAVAAGVGWASHRTIPVKEGR